MAYIDTSKIHSQPVQNTSKSTGFGFGDFLGSLFSPLTSLFGSIMNYKSQKDTNKTNMAINQQNLDYNAAMTQAQWERDDNAHQREVADLEAAGLSPLASTSGSGVSQAIGAPAPIAMQAPQLDVNGLLNSVIQMKHLDETKRHNQTIEAYHAEELTQAWKQISQEAEKIQLDNDKLNETFHHNIRMEELQAEANEELQTNNSENNRLREREIALEEYNRKMEVLLDEMNRATNGEPVKIIWCDSAEAVDEYLKQKEEAYKYMIAELGKYAPNAEGYSSSESNTNGINGGLRIFEGNGGDLGFQKGHSESSSYYKSENLTKQQEQIIRKYNETWGVPLIDTDKAKRNLLKGADYYYQTTYKKSSKR